MPKSKMRPKEGATSFISILFYFFVYFVYFVVSTALPRSLTHCGMVGERQAT